MDGQNVVIESRFADGRQEWVAELVGDLLALRPGVGLAAGRQALHAFTRATTTVPIVMAIITDPVETEAGQQPRAPRRQPDRSVAFQNQVLTTKRLELLKKAVPTLSRVRLPWDSSGGGVGYAQVELAPRTVQLRR